MKFKPLIEKKTAIVLASHKKEGKCLFLKLHKPRFHSPATFGFTQQGVYLSNHWRENRRNYDVKLFLYA